MSSTTERQRDTLRELLQPLVERMCRTHCWRKGKDGPRHVDEPFDEMKVNEHLFGGVAYGLSPIAPGECVTRTACIDLDDHGGALTSEHMLAEARLIAGALEQDGYKAHMFRSSGGAGIHLVLVWDKPQDAFSVREMLRKTLETCGYTLGTKGVAHQQAEAFPKQNEVAPDRDGSMWILPFGRGRGQPIGEFDRWISSPDVPVRERPAARERVTSAIAPELSRVKSALDAIPNADLPYELWRNIIFAVHFATGGSEAGLSLAHEFSARSSKYDPDFLDNRVWPYVQADRGGGVITERTLFSLATAGHDWQDPKLLDAFDVLEQVETPPVSKTRRFKPVHAADFTKGERQGWHIKNVIPAGEIVVVFGASGSGKSFFTFDAVASVARGAPWNGKRSTKGRVVYIFAEGAGGAIDRLEAYSKHHDVALRDIDLYLIGAAPNLVEVNDVKELIAELVALGPLSIVVCDTYAQMTSGADENSGQDMSKAIAACKAVKKATGATVILVAHSGKDASRGIRGWSGIKGAIDAEIEVTRADDDRMAGISKIKDGVGEGDEYGFRLVQVPLGVDEDDDLISSCVIEHTTAAVGRVKAGRKAVPLGEHEKTVLKSRSSCRVSTARTRCTPM